MDLRRICRSLGMTELLGEKRLAHFPRHIGGELHKGGSKAGHSTDRMIADHLRRRNRNLGVKGEVETLFFNLLKFNQLTSPCGSRKPCRPVIGILLAIFV